MIYSASVATHFIGLNYFGRFPLGMEGVYAPGGWVCLIYSPIGRVSNIVGVSLPQAGMFAYLMPELEG